MVERMDQETFREVLQGRGPVKRGNTEAVRAKPGIVTFTVHRPPMGAPRMTQRDKWKKRPVVIRYREWKDALRLAAGNLPPVNQIKSLSWTAYFEPPPSWSKSKRAEVMGELHRSKPDRDNVDKLILDGLFEQDSGIAHGTIEKRWGSPARVEVRIETI